MCFEEVVGFLRFLCKFVDFGKVRVVNEETKLLPLFEYTNL